MRKRLFPPFVIKLDIIGIASFILSLLISSFTILDAIPFLGSMVKGIKAILVWPLRLIAITALVITLFFIIKFIIYKIKNRKKKNSNSNVSEVELTGSSRPVDQTINPQSNVVLNINTDGKRKSAEVDEMNLF